MAVPLALLAGLTSWYLGAACYQRMASRHAWSSWRIASWLAGSVVIAVGLTPQLLPFPPGDLRQHMAQHLLLAMLGPLGLVMAAPMTLLLRTAPPRQCRWLVGILCSGLSRIWLNPVMALALNLGGMAALYFTPLYGLMMQKPAIHYLVHFHFIAAGYLYTWVIAGPDPAPHRLSVPARLVVLGVAVVIHSVLAQMLYAGLGVSVAASKTELERAAELMYYGGDITEMLLAFALVTTWRPRRVDRQERFLDAPLG